jgi:hypothetical protein
MQHRQPGEAMGKQPHQRPQYALAILLCALGLIIAPAKLIQAQTTDTPAPNTQPATPTLHVYANLEQVPVLVLTKNYERIKPLDTSKFRVSLDSGPLFPPAYVRQENEDPISLAILIDVSKPDNDILPQLAQAIASLSPDYLKPRDRVSIYALDCDLIRTAFNAPADATNLKQSVERAMESWQIRREKKSTIPPCKPSMPLWDSMASVLDDLAHQPGRRVLLAITDGIDSGSRTPWTKIRRRAQVESIAVFGLLPMPVIGTVNHQGTGEQLFNIHSPFTRSIEDKFSQICSLSGGVEFQARSATVSWRLKEFTNMVRERYILEFPRPPTEEAGDHSLQVSYKKRGLYIAPSGISLPVASEEEKKSADTASYASPVPTPVEGGRKILVPK